MGFLDRIRVGNFRESDVEVFYVTYREKYGPFIRETGDFVAHPLKDRGSSFKAAAGIYAQVAGQLTARNNSWFGPIGECPWWAKTFYMAKTDLVPPNILRNRIGLSKKRIKREISSWFDDGDEYPTAIKAINLSAYHDITSHYLSALHIKAAFKFADVRTELRRAFDDLGVPRLVLNNFLVATCILLNGKQVEIYPATLGSLGIGVTPPEHRDTFAFGSKQEFRAPDGPLQVLLEVEVPLENSKNPFRMAVPYFQTDLDTSGYFDRDFLRVDHNGEPWLDLTSADQFDSSIPVSAVSGVIS